MEMINKLLIFFKFQSLSLRISTHDALFNKKPQRDSMLSLTPTLVMGRSTYTFIFQFIY